MVRDGDIVVIHPFGADRPRTGDVVAFIHPGGRSAGHSQGDRRDAAGVHRPRRQHIDG